MKRRCVIGDWGSTHLRLWLVENDGIAARADGPGISRLAEPAAATLSGLLKNWRSAGSIAEVTLCGMAGAPGGLAPAP